MNAPTAISFAASAVLAAVVSRVATRMPWRTVATRAPDQGPYRAGGNVRGAVERVPLRVRLAAFSALFFAPAAFIRLALVLTVARWDGIAVGLLPIGALALAGAAVGIELLRPNELTPGHVLVVARGLIAYGIPLFGFGLLHDLAIDHPSDEALSFGTVSVELGGAGVVVGVFLMLACKSLATRSPHFE